MNKKLKMLLLGLILLLSNNVYAVTSAPPPIGQPLPSTLDSKWIILNNVKYENKLFYECKTYLLLNQTECEKQGYTVNEVLDKLVGSGHIPIGLSPYVGNNGNQLGIVLYYK